MTPKQRYAKIKEEVDFGPVLITAVNECGVKDLQAATFLLDAFLQWFSVYPEVSKADRHQMLRSVDPIWHAFILHTKLYRDVCEKYLGMYLDHDPTDVTDQTIPKAEYAEKSLVLLQQHFGPSLNPRLLHLSEIMTCCGPAGCKDPRRPYSTSVVGALPDKGKKEHK